MTIFLPPENLERSQLCSLNMNSRVGGSHRIDKKWLSKLICPVLIATFLSCLVQKNTVNCITSTNPLATALEP
jgi:hypothetical protein